MESKHRVNMQIGHFTKFLFLFFYSYHLSLVDENDIAIHQSQVLQGN